MKIELKKITIREVVEGYVDSAENGVLGYGGRLNIRPKYQREFVYEEKQRNAVVETVTNKFPLNVMYWAVCEDGTFEIIDGQQRTISICQYINGDFAYMFRYFHNLTANEQEEILNYELMIYFCSGTDSEKLKWFQTINIAGEELTQQELRNAVYSGEWVTDAKRYFSRNGCAASKIASDYVRGSAIRQEYLETAIKWISDGNIEIYMAKHQHDANAAALWRYFQSVITWVEQTFIKKRSIMKGVDWGPLYNKYKDKVYNIEELENKIQKLLLDDDVTRQSGIYPYLLTNDERHLSIRAFTPAMKLSAYERQKGVCPMCNEHFDIKQMEGDHITPWHAGGRTTAENCQMLCRDCNRRKSGK